MNLPSGEAGKEFIRELARLANSWKERSLLSDILIKTSVNHVCTSIYLKTKDHTSALERRLIISRNDDLLELLEEAKVI